MFIAQILHIPGAEQCRCPEKFIEIFGFSESRRNFGTFWFWHADSWARWCCRCSLHSSSVRRCEICRNRARSDSSRTSARLWTSPPSPPCLPPACLPRMSCVLFLFKSLPCPACVWAVPGPYPAPPVVADQLNWANPKSWMAQLDQSSLDHHLLLIPLIEAIVAFKNFCSTIILGNVAHSRSQN